MVNSFNVSTNFFTLRIEVSYIHSKSKKWVKNSIKTKKEKKKTWITKQSNISERNFLRGEPKVPIWLHESGEKKKNTTWVLLRNISFSIFLAKHWFEWVRVWEQIKELSERKKKSISFIPLYLLLYLDWCRDWEAYIYLTNWIR